MASAYRLYEVLELMGPTATGPQIKAAYRRLSALYHPDKVKGMENKFQEVKHAYEVLSNPDRRERYDRTGRDDDVKVTPKVIQNMVEQTVLAVISAETPDGREPDDPTWDNIKDKVVRSIQTTRRDVQANLKRARKQLARLEKMAKRFKSRTDADPVGDAFAVHRARLTADVHKFEDGLELSYKTEEAFAQYDYLTGEVGTEPEGQFSPAPTRRLSGPRYLSHQG